MMCIELVLASNNEHKHSEFRRLFPNAAVLRPQDVGISFDFEESGATFFDNAFGKALALFRAVRRPVIADDSGLCVRALKGEPGIMSSRYGSTPGGPVLETTRRNAILLDRLKGITDRRATFVCCLVLVQEEDRFIAVQETVRGVITEEPRGSNGFGYDPLFLLPSFGLTMAELPDSTKDEVSHRGRAASRLGECILLDS
jgi:XTP/dITP diphosphohydrolase